MNYTDSQIGPLRTALDVGKVSSYLLREIPQLQEPLEFRQFGYGQSNPTYLVIDRSGMQIVLRKKPPGTLLSKTAHAVEREYTVIRALQSTGIPVPKALSLCNCAEVIGTPFYVMQFLRGRIFTDPTLPDLSRDSRREIWKAAVVALARLHQVSYSDVGLSTFGKHSGFYRRQLKTLSAISESQGGVKDLQSGKAVGPIPYWGRLLSWLAENEPEERTTLVHGDYKIDNLIFDKERDDLIGIIDWELSTLGHPLSDLCNLCMPLTMPSNFEGAPSLVGSSKDVPLTIGEILSLYTSETGWNPSPFWKFGQVFALIRLAVITQGIAARSARGQASSERAKSHASLFGPLGRLAFEMVNDSNMIGKTKI